MEQTFRFRPNSAARVAAGDAEKQTIIRAAARFSGDATLVRPHVRNEPEAIISQGHSEAVGMARRNFHSGGGWLNRHRISGPQNRQVRHPVHHVCKAGKEDNADFPFPARTK